MKKIIKYALALVVILLVVRLCTRSMGSIIPLPGGMGTESSNESGGWFSPKGQDSGGGAVDDIDIEDLERELRGGANGGQMTTPTTPSPTPSASTPLTFKGIPITGTLSAFGAELVKAGFRNTGNGTYVGDFAGYSGCKVTPVGSNPVQEVRVDFPVISDWDALEKAYDNLQADLTRKYGMEPNANPATSNLAVYNLPNGTISLDADVKDRSTWHVILTYSSLPSMTVTTSSGRNPIDDL
ncbi:MAG: hypothetical protein IJP49_04005 [Bacteroidales bacterium]|nr:hypothetical protein [Bacteroidales bacterium]